MVSLLQIGNFVDLSLEDNIKSLNFFGEEAHFVFIVRQFVVKTINVFESSPQLFAVLLGRLKSAS